MSFTELLNCEFLRTYYLKLFSVNYNISEKNNKNKKCVCFPKMIHILHDSHLECYLRLHYLYLLKQKAKLLLRALVNITNNNEMRHVTPEIR